MSKIGKTTLMILVAVAMAGVMSCKEKAPPEAKAPMVQKITPSQPAPPTSNSSASSENREEATPAPETAAAGPAAGGELAEENASALIEASLKIASSYDPEGRFDPFEPLFKEEPGETEVVSSKEKRKKRVPQTPLERVALSQLKLSAIMRTPRGNSAIVEDATGKGYVVKKGTYIGLNSGQVILIDRARVVVEEEIENVLGELIIQNTELKLQKPAGEL